MPTGSRHRHPIGEPAHLFDKIEHQKALDIALHLKLFSGRPHPKGLFKNRISASLVFFVVVTTSDIALSADQAVLRTCSTTSLKRWLTAVAWGLIRHSGAESCFDKRVLSSFSKLSVSSWSMFC